MRNTLILFLILITGCSEDHAIEKESKPLSSIKFYIHCTYNPQLISDETTRINVMDIPDRYDYLLFFTTPDSEHKNKNIEINELVESVTRADMDMFMKRILGDPYKAHADYKIIDELSWPITIFENTSLYMFDEFNGKLGLSDRYGRADYKINRETLVMTRKHFSAGEQFPYSALSQCSKISGEEYKKFYESWLKITKTQMDKINEEKQAQEDKNKI